MLIVFVCMFLSAWVALEACVLGFCLWINYASKRNQEFLKWKALMIKQLTIALRDSHVAFRNEMSRFRDNILIPELKKYGLAVKEDTIPPWDHDTWHVRIIWADNPIYHPQYQHAGRVEFMTFEGGECLASLHDLHAPNQKVTQHVVLLDEYIRNWIMDARTWKYMMPEYRTQLAKDWAKTTYKEMKVLADKKRHEEWAKMPIMYNREEGMNVDWYITCFSCGGGVKEFPAYLTEGDLQAHHRRLGCPFCSADFAPLRFSTDIEYEKHYAEKHIKK